MTDQAMLVAQLEQARKELNGMPTLHCHIRDQKQCIDEYLQANINLRATNLLLEDDVRNLKSRANHLMDRITVLENEKAAILVPTDSKKSVQAA